jgi:spore coat polysaccharide biosynthesis predicted glycosyltransferase SpsG
LLVFGGVDKHDLSFRLYEAIRSICADSGICLSIVVGPGYDGYANLLVATRGDPKVTVTHATGVMSSFMEKADLAITSNGRTVYELAHLNVPGIVISQHKREDTHRFACEGNGFIPVGVYSVGETEQKVTHFLKRLIQDRDYRKRLHHGTKKYRFDSNKARVVNLIKKHLEKID